MKLNQKLRCQKPNHKQNLIQFVCIDANCRASTRTGCITCFPEHEGHTSNHMDIDDFFKEVQMKEKQVEFEYQNLLNVQNVKKNKDALLKQTQTKFKGLTQKVFAFLERHNEYITHYIGIKSISQDINSFMDIKSYHDELERIRTKPPSQLENRFLLSNDFESMLSHAQQQRDQGVQGFQFQIENTMANFEDQFNQLMNNLDQLIIQQIGNQNGSNSKVIKQSKVSMATPPPQFQSPLPARQKGSPNKQMSKSPQTQRQSTKTSSRTPEIQGRKQSEKKKVRIPPQQRFLITTPESGSEKFIQTNKQLEQFIQYLQLNYIREDYLQDNLDFLQGQYPDIFGIIDERVTQKDKIQIIQEQKGRLIKVLWDNWMVEWLKQALNQGSMGVGVSVKVHEIEENYNGFMELLEKSLQIHKIVAWLVKQKLNRPKVEYHTWLILAQGNQNKGNRFDKMGKVYRLYHIKSASKKDYRESHFFEEGEQRDTRGIYGITLNKILQDNLHGDFLTNEDSKVIVKGFIDPNFQTFLLAERIQIFLTLAAYNLSFHNQVMNIYNLENQFDSILINFQSFIQAINLVLKDYGDDQNLTNQKGQFQNQASNY